MLIAVLASLGALLLIFVMGQIFLSYVTSRTYSAGIAFFMGLGLLGIIANLLLFANAFEQSYLQVIVIALVVLFGWQKRHVLHSFLEQARGLPGRIAAIRYPELALLACLCAVVVVFVVLNFVPVTATDALGYHLPFVRDFILSHHINNPMAGITVMGLGYFPGLSEIIFAAITLLSGLVTISIPLIALQSAILIALVWTLYHESAFVTPRRSARIIPLLVLFAAPDFRDSILLVGTIDLLVFSCIAVGVLLIVRSLCLRERMDMYFGAFLLGCALAMKYHALLAAAFCAFLVVVFYLLEPKVRGWVWRPALFSALIGALIPAYWYIKNALLYYNPIYPLFSGQGPEAEIHINSYLPHTVWVKLLYPIVVYMPFLFNKSNVAHLAGAEAALAVVGILGAVVLFLKTRRMDPAIAALLGFVLWYSWIFSFLADERRYNLPALIIFAVLDGALLDRLLNAYKPRVTSAVAYGTALCFFILLPFLLHSDGERVNVLRGAESPDAYIISQTPDHSVAAYHALMDIR